MTGRIDTILSRLASGDPEERFEALELMEDIREPSNDEKSAVIREFASFLAGLNTPVTSAEARLAVNARDRIALLAADVESVLVEEIANVDIESAAYLAKALATRGKPGLNELMNQWPRYVENSDAHIKLIQAVGYYRLSDADAALPRIIEAARHKNEAVRAKALFTLAQLIRKSKKHLLDEGLLHIVVNLAFELVCDSHALVRKNAVAILGQLSRRKILSISEDNRVQALLIGITGKGENNAWDSAFVVRQEAEHYLRHANPDVPQHDRYRQSFRILRKRCLCQNTFHFTIEAPFIARKIQAGQFIIVRPHERSERIPLSICGWNRDKGTIEIIVSAVGRTSTDINELPEGASLKDIVGPLGERSHVPARPGICIMIGGGYGAGAIIPAAMDLKKRGHVVVGIVGARNSNSLIMVDELKAVCDEVIVTTNDGSSGREGLVTDALREILSIRDVSHVLAIGPVPMMQAVAEMTRSHKIETFVSLNAIMVDGTGMCGACRVSVGQSTKFACIHGPDFDGHEVDFENLMKRQKMFVKEEQLAIELMKGHAKKTTCEHH